MGCGYRRVTANGADAYPRRTWRFNRGSEHALAILNAAVMHDEITSRLFHQLP